MSCKDLPHELWVQVLQHVPVQQRLSSCALFCQKLSRAATAATQSLQHELAGTPQHLAAFLGWTSSHGSLLTTLFLWSMPNDSSIRQLPCPNLVELQLANCSV